MAEWGGLENRYTRKGIEGSNPSLSAKKSMFIVFSYSDRFYLGFVLKLNDSIGFNYFNYEHCKNYQKLISFNCYFVGDGLQ